MANPEIVLIGSGINVLGTARSLAHAGFQPVVLSEQPDLERYSRHYRPFPASGSEIFLLNAITRESIDAALSRPPWNEAVIVPCSDHAVKAVAESVAAGAGYKAVLPSPALLAALTDKAEFAELLTRYKVPHPKTLIVAPGLPFPGINNRAGRNYFLKPRDSQAFFRVYGVKGLRLGTGDDPEARINEIRSRGFEVIVQEYIPGGAENHIYVEGYIGSDGELKALFARRRLRMYPPDYGNSTAMISIPLSEVTQAVDDLTRMLAEVSYRGIFSAEFKRDPEDGVYKLIEINPRAWWYIHFAEMCGVNIAALAVADALGEKPLPIANYRAGYRSVFGYYDIYALAEIHGGLLRAVFSLPRAWFRSSFLVFALDDPAPAVVTCWKQVIASMRRRLFGQAGSGTKRS